MKLRNRYKPKAGIIILLLFCNGSCDVTDGDEFTNRYTYQFQNQAQIVTDTVQRRVTEDSTVTVLEFSVEPGDSTVFTFTHSETPPEEVMDGGFTETLVFQLSSGAREFELSGSALDEATVLYRRSCFCALARAAFVVTSGTISGEKISTVHWIISADVQIETVAGTYRVEFEEPFYSNF